MEDSGAGGGGGDDSFVMQDDQHSGSAFARSPPMRRRDSDAALHDLTADAANEQAALPTSSSSSSSCSASAPPTGSAFARLLATQLREATSLAVWFDQELKLQIRTPEDIDRMIAAQRRERDEMEQRHELQRSTATAIRQCRCARN
jgi:hypothetical protein